MYSFIHSRNAFEKAIPSRPFRCSMRPSLSAAFGLVLLLAMTSSAFAFPNAPLVLAYRVTEPGADVRMQDCLVEPSKEGWRLTIHSQGASRAIVATATMETIVEEYRAPQSDTRLILRKTDSVLELTGHKGQSAVQKGYRATAPWVASPLQLCAAVLAGTDEIRFCTANARQDTFWHVTLHREGTEDISICGKRVSAVRYEYTATDFLGKSRKSTYWYRADDGLLLAMQDQPNANAAPTKRVELVRETPLEGVRTVAHLRGPTPPA